MEMTKVNLALLRDHALLRRALVDALARLAPWRVWRNPVLFVVWVCAAYTTALGLRDLTLASPADPPLFTLALAAWLWFTVLFANLAEALAEGQGKAQAESLRRMRHETTARRLAAPSRDSATEEVPSSSLRRGDLVLVETGEWIPGDGDVVEGVASVDESAITGESAPVIRESGGDRTAVTGGTKVLSDWLVVRISSEAGGTFLDRMIALVEGARRRRTPNEIALGILLAALSLIFLVAVATLPALTAGLGAGADALSPVLLASLLVCLIPTTIGGLLSAIGVAGMNRMFQARVLATSGRAVEAAGDVSVLLMDKTGTITLGNRQAKAFLPAYGIGEEELAEAAQLASLADETPEGRSIVVLAKERHGIRSRSLGREDVRFVPFSAQTRMSGVDLGTRRIRKGAVEAMAAYLAQLGGEVHPELARMADEVAGTGGTPLLVADGGRVLGLVELRDVLKPDIRERFGELRRMGIRTVMVTGDNPRTAAAIAAEAGVDEFLAEATPERKLQLIREHQAGGRMVAMTGDGSNDAPALAQADVAVAMNTGTQAAREAGNMVDLDSDPTKLLEVVTIGKQLLVTRGALTTFSVANDLSKYFAILPALFTGLFPPLAALNVMGLATPRTAVLSAVIFNALIVVALIPLALRGVDVRPAPARVLLLRNLLLYGVGGVLLPFPAIKLIDMVLVVLGVS